MSKTQAVIPILTALTVIAGTLAFKASSTFSSGSVYCTSTCPTSRKIPFRLDCSGTVLAPCGLLVQPYVLVGNSTCLPTKLGALFSQTDAGN